MEHRTARTPSAGTFTPASITSLTVSSPSLCLLFHCRSQQRPEEEAHFHFHLHHQSHLHYRDPSQSGEEACLKYPPGLGATPSGFPEEIKNNLTGGRLSRPRPCSYTTVTVPTGQRHTWVLFKFTVPQIERRASKAALSGGTRPMKKYLI